MCWCKNLGASLSQKEKQNGLFTLQAVKHSHGKPDSQSCLEFPLEKFRHKSHPSLTPMLALFHGMLLVAQINLPAFPTLLPAWHSPYTHITHTFPHPMPLSTGQRTAGCPLVQRVARESPAWSVVCPPRSLSPSECLHWSISSSRGAFSANPAGSLMG